VRSRYDEEVDGLTGSDAATETNRTLPQRR
jgi:hypothetical protein